MAKYPSQHSPLEQKADKLWQAFSQTETEEFWRKYLALTKKARRQEHLNVQTFQKPLEPIQTFYQKQLASFPFFRSTTIFIVLLLLAIVAAYWLIQTNLKTDLTNAWRGYITQGAYRETYDSIKNLEMLHLKETIVGESLVITVVGSMSDENKVFTQQELAAKIKTRDSLQQVFETYHEEQTKAKFHQKIRDSLFKDYGEQSRSRLDSLYAYCKTSGKETTKNLIRYYLKVGGGIDGCKTPYNLSDQNSVVYRLLNAKNTMAYFVVNKNKKLARVIKLGSEYYRFTDMLPSAFTVSTSNKFEGLIRQMQRVNQYTNVYKATLSLVYTNKNYPVKVGLLGAYYETSNSNIYIKQKDRAQVKTQLKVELYRKAKEY